MIVLMIFTTKTKIVMYNMNEFIEKLIDRLEEEREKSFSEYTEVFELYREEFWRGRMGGFTNAIEIVNQIAEEYNNGWIPVSERLPEDGGYYLVVYHNWSDGNYLPKYDDVRVKVMHYQVKDLATGYSGWNYPRTIGENADLIEADQHREVTHWKPLPSLPYQPKGE